MSKKKKTKTYSPNDNGEESSNEEHGERKHKSSSRKHHSYSSDRSSSKKNHSCSCDRSSSKKHHSHSCDRSSSKKHYSHSCDRSTKSQDECSTSNSKDVYQSGRHIKKAVYKLPKDITHETQTSDKRSGEKVEGKTPSLAIEPKEKGHKRPVQDREEVKKAAKHPYPTSSHTTSDKHSDGSRRLTSKQRNVTEVHSTAKPLQSQLPPTKESVHDGTSKQRNITQVSSTAKPLQSQVPPKKESVHDGTSKQSNVTQVPSTAKPLQSQVPPKKESVHGGTSKQRNVTQVPSIAKPLQSPVPPKKESIHDGTSNQRNVTKVPSTAKPLQSQVPPKKEVSAIRIGTPGTTCGPCVEAPNLSVHDGTSKQRNVTQVSSTAKPLQSQVPPEKESVHDGTSKQRNVTEVSSTAKPLQSQVPPKKEGFNRRWVNGGRFVDGGWVAVTNVTCRPARRTVAPIRIKLGTNTGQGSAIKTATPGTTCEPCVEATNLSVHDGTSNQRNVTQVPSTAKLLQSQVPPKKEVSAIRTPGTTCGPYLETPNLSVHDGTSNQWNVSQVPSTAKPLQSQVPPKKEVSAIRIVSPGTTCGPCVEAPNLSIHDGTQVYDNDIEMQVVEELHEARSKDSLALKNSYGELTSMALSTDPSVEVATGGPGLPRCRIIIALDTNILLSHLDFVKKIMSHGLGAMGFPVILIPWVVLQELDSLKNGKKLRECVARLACPAVHFIYTCLKNQDSGVWGQSMQQASQSCQDLTTYNNDDRVLQCCLQYQSLYPERALCLCTNDKNLCSKSLFSGVKALSKTDLEERAKTYGHSPHPTLEACDGRRPIVNTLTIAPTLGERTDGWQRLEKVTPLNTVQENERDKEAEERKTELSNCVSLMEDCLKEALSAILEAEMKAAFDDLWFEMVYVKPPWSLKAVLECLKKHWIAVFGSIVPRHRQQTVKNLIDFFSPGKTVDCSTMLVALCEAKSLLVDFQCRSTYGSHVPTTLSSLDGIIRKLQPQTTPQPEAKEKAAVPASHHNEKAAVPARVSHPHENVAAQLSHQHENSPMPMEYSHQDVWALFEDIWMRCDHLRSQVFETLHFDPDSMQVNWPQGCPPPPHVEEAWAKLHHLSSVVTNLIQAFFRVWSNSGLEETQALHTLIYSEIFTMDDAKFTAKDLLDCFAQQEYREKLKNGGTKLEALKASLEHCVEAMRQTAWH